MAPGEIEPCPDRDRSQTRPFGSPQARTGMSGSFVVLMTTEGFELCVWDITDAQSKTLPSRDLLENPRSPCVAAT